MTWSFTILGGGQEIGANAYLLKVSGVPILLDAGLHPKKYGQESLPDYGWIQEGLEAIFISHAHRYELLEMARRLHPRRIVRVHGMKEGMEFLQEELGQESQILIGEKGKTIPLD